MPSIEVIDGLPVRPNLIDMTLKERGNRGSGRWERKDGGKRACLQISAEAPAMPQDAVLPRVLIMRHFPKSQGSVKILNDYKRKLKAYLVFDSVR